jgi:hypothetical protein
MVHYVDSLINIHFITILEAFDKLLKLSIFNALLCVICWSLS